MNENTNAKTINEKQVLSKGSMGDFCVSIDIWDNETLSQVVSVGFNSPSVQFIIRALEEAAEKLKTHAQNTRS